jgi:D-alanine-D-alanine ligase
MKAALSNGVVIIYNAPVALESDATWRESDAGVADEVLAVQQALVAQGCAVRLAAVHTLQDAAIAIAAGPEQVVFNLVEALAGDPSDYCQIPVLCKAAGRVYTGNPAACQVLCLDKSVAKQVLRDQGIPVPSSVTIAPSQDWRTVILPDFPVIVKPVRTDASEGIEGDAVVLMPDRGHVGRLIERIHRNFKQAAMVEQYLDGREINVALLQDGDAVRVLPAAEIKFLDYPAGKPRIVDYAAKWRKDTFEYSHTVRTIPADLPADTAAIIARIAEDAWRAMGCRGYARVDFRLDHEGYPFVLEVNPNPDISPDSGFAAALEAAGIPYTGFAAMVLRAATSEMPEPPAVIVIPTIEPELLPPEGAPFIRRTRPADRDPILEFVKNTGFFRDDEVDVAREVLHEALAKGLSGHYQSFSAMIDDQVAGWICYGATPCTVGTYDIYWIVVDARHQRRGIGAALMREAETRIRAREGRVLIIETAGQSIYGSTRHFYQRLGYVEEARLRDFYTLGDDKIVYIKRL